jgi:hypothetical protein
MAGGVGFDDVRERLRLAPDDWLAIRARVRGGGPPPGEPDERVEAWVADGCPRRRGSEYAAYFFDLDAWTEYWDVYRPETRGRYHFGDGSEPGYLSALMPDPGRSRAPVFDAWKALALASFDEPPPDSGEFRARAAEAAEAALALDELVCRLLHEHFGAEVDVDAYFDAIERFATDTLPPIPERTALLAPDDVRRPSSGTHMLAGDIMWFAWALQLECAQLAAGPSPDRALLMAGVALGCALDYAHTGRCRTRAAYQSADVVWTRARGWARDFDAAARELRELFYIRTYDEP